MVKLFMVDDHEIVRRGLRELLESDDELEVVGEAATAEEALARLEEVEADVALLDLRLPDGNGVELCREIRSRWPRVVCVILTSYADDEALQGAVLAGASGYVLKQVRGTDLIDSVHKVANGHSLIDAATFQRALERLRSNSAPDGLDTLTPQERRILELIGEGMTNRQIGQQLHLAEKTVKNYVSNVLAKLGMSRRTEAAVFAARRQQQRFDGT